MAQVKDHVQLHTDQLKTRLDKKCVDVVGLDKSLHECDLKSMCYLKVKFIFICFADEWKEIESSFYEIEISC